MNDSHYGAPGIGGSLGECGLCGENFMAEIVLGSSIKSFKLGGTQTFYAHDKCIEQHKHLFGGHEFKPSDLPEKSPIRKAFEQQQQEPTT